MKILETKRLALFELSPADSSFLLKLLNDPDWIRFIGDRGVRTENQALNYLNERLIPAYAQQGYGFYLVRLKEGDHRMGICGIIKRDFLTEADIGYAFLPEYTGKGYALESCEAILQHAKENLRLKKLLAFTHPENQRSLGLLARLGFRSEGKIKVPGEKTESSLYGYSF